MLLSMTVQCAYIVHRRLAFSVLSAVAFNPRTGETGQLDVLHKSPSASATGKRVMSPSGVEIRYMDTAKSW